MGRHALRGAVSAWLALIALQAIGTQGGSGRVATAFQDLDAIVKRALDPKVPAIPDRRTGTTSAGDTPAPYLNGITPNQLRNAAQAAPIIATPQFQQGVNTVPGVGTPISGIDTKNLGTQLSGLSNYTPDQLMQMWGITP